MIQGHPEDVVTTESLTKLYSTPVCVTEAEAEEIIVGGNFKTFEIKGSLVVFQHIEMRMYGILYLK